MKASAAPANRATAPVKVKPHPQVKPQGPAQTRAHALASMDNQLAQSVALGPPDSGQPLALEVRLPLERQLGTDLSPVRVHGSRPANRTADALRARAFTYGNDIWLGTNERSDDAALMAHESSHVVQQRVGPRLIQRQPIGEAVGLPTAEDVRADPATMTRYVTRQSEQSGAVDEQLAGAHPSTPEEREALEETLVRAVRLNAIGLMASHRASIEEAKERLEGRARFPVPGEAPPQPTASLLGDMREAAQLVTNLRGIEARLMDYRDGLHGARSRAIFRRGSLSDALALVMTNGAEFMDPQLRAGLREGWAAAERMNSYWLWVYGAANALMELRDQQITGVRLAISEVYGEFPLFAQLEPGEVGNLTSDIALLDASRAAYQRVLGKIDEAIRNIATGDIHPFDLPRAIDFTASGKPEPVRQALNEAVERHEMQRFWLTMGLTAAEVLLCFIPVVGPALALGLGAIAVGMTLEDMLDRLTVARASTDPFDSPVGVHEPSTFEWAMAGVAGILMAFGGAGIARSAMRGFRAFQTVSRVAPELSAGSRIRLARMIVDQPALLASPRTSAGLEAQLRATGVELGAAEIGALRAASFEAAGLPVPRSSSQSLDDFLAEIWRDEQAIRQRAAQLRTQRRDPSRPVYSRYSRGRQPNPLQPGSQQQYLNRLDRLRAGRPQRATDLLQGDAVEGFHHFRRAGADLQRVQQRIYLNVSADQAPEVMEFVVRNLVDDASVPGVQAAKLSGPGAVQRRADAIVIYIDDAANTEAVLARIRGFQEANPTAFRAGGPQMTEEALPGVHLGEEPAAMHGGASFGDVRANAILRALEDTAATGGNQQQFVARVRDLLRNAGIDPDAPHMNLPPPAAPVSPPSGGGPGTPTTPPLLLGGADRDRDR